MGGYPGYYICAPISHLWTSYPIQVQLEDIASHLEVKGRLSNGSWTGVPTTATPLTEWFTQTPVLKHFCLIFNDIQSFVHGEHQSDTTIVYAGPSKPPHLQSATAYPEAMLVVKGKVGKERSWADLICPFESAYHPRCIERSKSKVLWALERILLCDVRRCFSFGVDVAGATFRIWFACRSSLFEFAFDWLEDPGSLIRFFTILATSSGPDLGIDANISAVDAYSSRFAFNIGGTTYQTLKCLYDDGATGVCGRGTRAFEARSDAEAAVLVIKDCWLEDGQERALEHDTVEKVRSAVGQAEFRRRFIDVCGHRITRNAALDRVCGILKRDFNKYEGFYATPIHRSRQPVEPKQPPRPRFRYQIVYREKGESFYHITSLHKAYLDLNEVTKSLYCLHTSKFVHGDVSPGNIFSYEGGAKLSDLEFARERDVDKLDELTLETRNSPSPQIVEHLVGTRPFTAAEVTATFYMFLPRHYGYDNTTGDDTLKELIDLLVRRSPDPHGIERMPAPLRVFLYTPLHDYESVWWIATWVLFKCRPKSLGQEELDYCPQSQWPSIFDDKTDRELMILAPRVFLTLKKSLPRVLHPLFEILEVFRKNLVRAYQEYEESFDGSIILQNVEVFHRCLERLAKVAAQVEIWDFPRSSTVGPSTARLYLPQDTSDGLESDITAMSWGASERRSTRVEATPTMLEKRKASGPLDPPTAKIRSHSEQRRA